MKKYFIEKYLFYQFRNNKISFFQPAIPQILRLKMPETLLKFFNNGPVI